MIQMYVFSISNPLTNTVMSDLRLADEYRQVYI